jgi:glutathione S-transferase
MAMTLYLGSYRYSSWSLRGYLAFLLSGAKADLKKVLLDQPTTAAEMAKFTPAGRVPVLHHDGLVIWDSMAIIEYLNELYPEAQMWPADRAQRARARSISAEMHAGFTALRTQMPMDILSHKPGVGHTPAALADAQRIMEIWREQLATYGGPFLFGKAMTVADVMYAPVTTRFTTYGVEVDPVSRGYVETIAKLPAFQRWKAEAKDEPEIDQLKV